MIDLRRRDFLAATAAGMGILILPDWAFAAGDAPGDDPAAALKLGWTGSLKWGNVVDVTRFDGRDWHEKLTAAQRAVVEMGGGVVYFPAGKYQFRDHLKIKDGVVLRGADPRGVTEAANERYAPPTRFEFPRYEPSFGGDGAPIDSAFKGICLEYPAGGANTGVVNIDINRGHIHLLESEDHRCGANRIVFGCVLRNAAVADPSVPYLDEGQHAWQRFTARHHAAIDAKAAENLLVANNRLPKSGDDDFVMKGFVLRKSRGKTPVYDVPFDYDNRPGLYINHYCVGGAGGSGDDGTPQSHPYGFRKGTVIVDNYVYNTGRMGIGFCGDGVICSRNITRIEKDVWRPTATGRDATYGSSTNDNRAIEMRGWRWVVENNDCEVHRNWCADRSYLINDGEGLMHEDHCNSTVVDSRLVGNKVNSYLSIYKCGPIDGLHVEGNDVSIPGQIADIYVVANRNSGPQPCRNVTIVGNVTRSNGILLAGDPASGNVIQGNQHKSGRPGYLKNEAKAKVEGNKNYEAS
ncbi:MAG: hypothetical protein RIC55_00915 [Pirellulaceae bacterium]